jgi:hypothetical protein
MIGETDQSTNSAKVAIHPKTCNRQNFFLGYVIRLSWNNHLNLKKQTKNVQKLCPIVFSLHQIMNGRGLFTPRKWSL